MNNKKFIKKVLKKLKRKGAEEISVIESPKLDWRKNPDMNHVVLDLSSDMLYEAKLNKRFLEEGFVQYG